MGKILGLLMLGLLACSPTLPTPLPTPSPTPIPTPSPTPASSCPPLYQWRAYVYHCTYKGSIAHEEDGKTPRPTIGGNCTIDTTPWYSGLDGIGPCNSEHNFCGPIGAACEDPRGPEFVVTHTTAREHGREANPFQYEFRGLGPGRNTLVVEPRADLQDANGNPIKVEGPGGFTVSFTAKEPL